MLLGYAASAWTSVAYREVGKGREHAYMDVSSRATQEAKAEERKLTPLWGEYSWGVPGWVPLWGVSMSDLSLGFHKKAVTLAHSAHGFC